jgi:hypothetical protein
MKEESGSNLSRYAMELFVVFIGVYGAVWLENYFSEQEQAAQTEKVVAMLREDLEDQVRMGGVLVNVVGAQLDAWDAEYKNDEKPIPFVLRIERSETPPVFAWDAVTRSDAVELLEPSLIFDLGFFYSEVEGVGRKLLRYVEFTDSQVMPGIKRGNEWFYDDETGQLHPEFAAHMDRLRDISNDSEEIADWAACLVERLENFATETDSCRPRGSLSSQAP